MTQKALLWIMIPLGALSISLSLASCAPSSGVTIQDLSNIPGGVNGPHVQRVGSNSITIVFTSSVPVVCNVTYGTDDRYGKVAVMPMAGATTQHELLLAGLEPDTTYHFKATVTDIAGNIYQSNDLTFHTATATSERKPAGVNVAVLTRGAKIVGVSSNWGLGDMDSSFGGNKAIDGAPDTAWSSNGEGDKAWIEIELSQSYNLNAIGFWTRTMGNSAQISSFNVITDSAESLGPFELPDAATMHYFEVQTRAQRLRFEVERSSGGNTGAVEIEVYSLE